MRRVFVLLLGFVPFALPSTAQAAGFSDWAAVVVAGDWHAHSGAPSEVFDNARRDIASELVTIGFSPANVLQFSVRPDRYANANPEHSDPQSIANALWDLSNRTSSGCLAYFTSHGGPDGIVMDEGTLSPSQMEGMISNACGDRPTVVIVSACFSGVFVPKLSGPNRLVFTAARPDRTSFGCGESDKYTFFDTCFLKSLPSSGDFPDLAKDVKSCVSVKEQQIGALPSEPQLSIGATIPASLPHWR